MGIQEVWILAAVSQALQAAQVFCTKAAAVTSGGGAPSQLGIIAYQVGAQFFGNMYKLATWGSAAAQAEFSTKQAQEGTVASKIAGLPPIT